MNKLIQRIIIPVSLVLITGCTVTETTYTPNYNSAYTYSVGYYGYPYRNDDFYSSYLWGNNYWYGQGAYLGGVSFSGWRGHR